MDKISAVIITLNEEDNILRCLESLRNVADEILVADSGSEDNTVKVCQEWGAHVEEFKWEGYAETKNRANSMTAFDYILSIDADEALSAELTESLLICKKQGLSGAYECNRLTCYCGKWIRHCGWYPDRKVRLFPKNKAKWVGDHVHEVLVCDLDLTISRIGGDLLHYSYTSLEDHYKRSELYAALGAEKLHERKVKALRFKAVFSPLLRFIRMYFFQLGFLDGVMGWHVCRNISREVRLKYRKAFRDHSGKKRH